MSVSRWRYTEACEGRVCCGDCDECGYEDEEDECVVGCDGYCEECPMGKENK